MSSLSSSLSSESSSRSDSSASSSVDTLEIRKLASAKTIREAVTPSEQNVQRISTSDEFDKVIGKYVDPLTIDAVDFSQEQVILIYDGEVNSCAQHLEFNQDISARSEDNGIVKVTLHYNLIPDDDKCSPSFSNPFAIYSIKTRKPLISEDIVDAKH